MINKSKKVVPTRGSVEDWSGEKNEEMLEKKTNYSKRIWLQKIKGEPDFEEKFADTLTVPRKQTDQTKN